MWMITLLTVLLALAVLIGDADAAPLWGRWGRTLTAERDAAPDTAVRVTLTAPSGRTHAVDGYWDGGRTWGVRFMPDEEGTWHYRTQATPAAPGLDGQEGGFACRRDASDNPFQTHGPLRVAESGYHLAHADGTPFFFLGDTVWNGPMLSEAADWEVYLNDRAGKRFSAVQFNTLAPWRTAPADIQGETAFTGSDPVQINPRFFQQLDARMDAINDRGLLAVPVLVWSLTKLDPGSYLSEEDCLRLVRYQIARYGAHHVVWILAGDNRYNEETAEKWKRVGRAAFGDKPHAPVATHPTGMNWPWDDWKDEAWLDILGYQSGHGDDARTLAWVHSGPPSKGWQEKPARPRINLEPPYEGHVSYQSKQRHTAYTTRRVEYWSLLNAPTAGLTYGGHGVWSWHTRPGEPPTDHSGTGTAPTWREGLSLPGSADIRHMADLFTPLPWWTLRPDPSLLTAQPGGDDPARFVAAARSEKGDLAVLYLPVGGAVTLSGDWTQAEWFDPRTGARKPAAAGRTFTAPDEEDWALVLRGR